MTFCVKPPVSTQLCEFAE